MNNKLITQATVVLCNMVVISVQESACNVTVKQGHLFTSDLRPTCVVTHQTDHWNLKGNCKLFYSQRMRTTRI